MKKFLTVVLIATITAFTLCLSGCSSSVDPKNAVELNWDKVWHEYTFENEARAKQEWDGKTVKWDTMVSNIGSTYSTPYVECNSSDKSTTITVWFADKDVAAKLNKGDKITVVGKLELSSFPDIKDAILV